MPRLKRSICTIINSKYLPQALALAESLERVTANSRDFFVLVTDAKGTFVNPCAAIKFLTLSELNISTKDFENFSRNYDVVEMSTALKPRLMLHLLLNGFDVVTYLDPDTIVYGSISEAENEAIKKGIVLTPHRLTPCSIHNLSSQERRFLRYGTFNLGFISISSNAKPFLNWWITRTTWFATRQNFSDYFTDQKWINLVPALFEHSILKHPGYNVAPWNIDERHLIFNRKLLKAQNKPLVFFHFSQISSLIVQSRSSEASTYVQNDFNINNQTMILLNHLISDYENKLKSIRELADKILKSNEWRESEVIPSPFTRIANLNRSFIRHTATHPQEDGRKSALRIFNDVTWNLIMKSQTVVNLLVGIRQDFTRLRKRKHSWY